MTPLHPALKAGCILGVTMTRTLSECWLRGVHDRTRCGGEVRRWLLMRDGDAGRAVQVVVCDRHASTYTFTQVIAVAAGAQRPSSSTPRRITRLRTTPATAGLKVTQVVAQRNHTGTIPAV